MLLSAPIGRSEQNLWRLHVHFVDDLNVTNIGVVGESPWCPNPAHYLEP